MSEVFEATSFSICAPMSSLGSLSSISLATVTPSLVIVGLPNFLSMTTLRPFGPRVTFTASASWSTPRLSRERATVLNSRYLAAIYSSLAQLSFAMTSDSLIRMISSSSSSTCEPVYFPYTTRSPTFSSIGTRWPFSIRPGPTAMTSPWIGFSLAVSGMYRPPFISSVSSIGRIATRSASGKTFSFVFVAVVMTCCLHLMIVEPSKSPLIAPGQRPGRRRAPGRWPVHRRCATHAETGAGCRRLGGVTWEPIRDEARVADEPTAVVTVNRDHVPSSSRRTRPHERTPWGGRLNTLRLQLTIVGQLREMYVVVLYQSSTYIELIESVSATRSALSLSSAGGIPWTFRL